MNPIPRKQAENGLFRDVWKVTNQILDYLKTVRPVDGRGVRISQTMNGCLFTVESTPSVESGAKIQQYQLFEVAGDYYRCRRLIGDSVGTSDVYIAKPFRLRRTPFDGESISFSSDGDAYTATYSYTSDTRRVVTIDNVPETQIVIPKYKVEFDIIYAMESEDDLDLTVSVGGEDEAITLIDINADGRAWARVA